MPYGFGRGYSFRGGSPPWPFVDVRRGGLPRCGYLATGAAWSPEGVPDTSSAPRFPVSASPQFNGESEIQYLRGRAEILRREFERIESRIKETEG
jgi:hypothetical protein